MKRFAIVLTALVALYVAAPAGAQTPGAGLNSGVSGTNLTNGQTTAVGLVASWIASTASQVGSLFTTSSPISNLFSSSPPSALQTPPYGPPAGTLAVPNPQTMTVQQFGNTFGIYQLPQQKSQ
jgi:hypothetical protein